MTVIKLQTRLFHRDDSESINCKRYVHNVLNKVYEELDECMESLKYTGNREELAKCHLNHSNLFKKVSLLFKVLKHASVLRKSTENLRDAKEGNLSFISIADRIAYLFEDIKLSLVPEININTTLRLYKDYRLLYPRIFVSERQINSYSEIHMLTKIYLLKEDAGEFNVHIEKGSVLLNTECFVFKLILCGELKSPKWKLIYVNRRNKALWLLHLPSDVTKLNFFVKWYHSLEEAKKVYHMFVSDSFFKNLVKGTPREFSLNYIVRLKLQVKRGRLACTVFNGDNTEYFSRNIRERYEQEIEKALKSIDRRARFSLERKIFMDSISFCSVAELQEHLYREKEDSVFYNMLKHRRFIKNYKRKDFGVKNVFMRVGLSFVCIKLCKVENDEGTHHIEADVFVGKVLENSHLCYVKLLSRYNGDVLLTNSCRYANDWSLEGKIMVPAHRLMSFIDKKLSILLGMADMLVSYENVVFCMKSTLEIWFGGERFEVAEDRDMLLINGMYSMHKPESICKFFEFNIMNKQLKAAQDMEFSVESGYHHYRLKDIKFSLIFADRTILETENTVFYRMVPNGDFVNAVSGFYYIYIYNIHPTFVCQDYLIFDFKMTLGDQLVLKTRSDIAFFVKKSYFATSNFQLSPFNHCYSECSANNEGFFIHLRSIYLKERFLALGRALKKEVVAYKKKQTISLTANKNIVLCLEDDQMHIDVDGRPLHSDLMTRFVRTFCKEHHFIGPLVEMLGML